MIAIFWHALEGVITLLIIGSVGYGLGAKGWLTKEINEFITKYINSISLPLYMFCNLVSTFNHDELLDLSKGAFVPVISITLTYIIGLLVVKFIGVEKKHEGLFKASFAGSNVIFIGIPVTIALFGEEAIAFVLIYYIVNTIYFWTIGQYNIISDSGQMTSGFFSLNTLKKLFTNPLKAFIIATILILLKVQVPEFLLTSARHIGSSTTPLALIVIGYQVFTIKIRNIRMTKDLSLLMVARFIIAPIMVVVAAKICPVPIPNETMVKVFIIVASLPVISQAVIMTVLYNTDTEFGATAISLSTLISIVAIPVFMVLVNL